jgi:RNA polymerase sigma-70 factor (ECF subfamily)
MMTKSDDRVGAGEPCRGAADEPSDYLLLGRLRSGSQEAALHIYRRYAQRLLALARARCANLPNVVSPEDIVQAVFGTFFRKAQCGRYDIPDGEGLWKLFLVLALNRIRAEMQFYLAAKRDARLTCPLECLEPAQLRGASRDGCQEGFLNLVVEEALERLPEQHRAIVQKRLEGHGVAEIAEQLGRSKRSVERILQESRDRLRGLLQDSE